MGYAAIVMLTLMVGYALQVGMGYDTAFTSITSSFTGSTYNSTTHLFQNSTMSQGNLIVLGYAVVGGSAILSGLFPNPYGIFSLIFALLLSLVTFPIQMFTSANTGLPDEVKMLVASVFGVLYLLAWLFGYKGGSD